MHRALARTPTCGCPLTGSGLLRSSALPCRGRSIGVDAGPGAPARGGALPEAAGACCEGAGEGCCLAALLGEPEDCCALPRRREATAELSSEMLLPAPAIRLASRHCRCDEHLLAASI